MDLQRLPPRTDGGAYRVVVESPRGSRVKLKYEPTLGAFEVGRPLPLGMTWPYDWGFIPGTQGPDGDPVDALVYWDVPTYPGAVVACRLLGALQLEEHERGERIRNDRLVTIPMSFDRGDDVRTIHDLAPRVRDDLAQFFTSNVYFTSKEPRVLGWCGPDEAARIAGA